MEVDGSMLAQGQRLISSQYTLGRSLRIQLDLPPGWVEQMGGSNLSLELHYADAEATDAFAMLRIDAYPGSDLVASATARSMGQIGEDARSQCGQMRYPDVSIQQIGAGLKPHVLAEVSAICRPTGRTGDTEAVMLSFRYSVLDNGLIFFMMLYVDRDTSPTDEAVLLASQTLLQAADSLQFVEVGPLPTRTPEPELPENMAPTSPAAQVIEPQPQSVAPVEPAVPVDDGQAAEG
jgi:hypothetical protein